jgi:hypothetical protein
MLTGINPEHSGFRMFCCHKNAVFGHVFLQSVMAVLLQQIQVHQARKTSSIQSTQERWLWAQQ